MPEPIYGFPVDTACNSMLVLSLRTNEIVWKCEYKNGGPLLAELYLKLLASLLGSIVKILWFLQACFHL